MEITRVYRLMGILLVAILLAGCAGTSSSVYELEKKSEPVELKTMLNEPELLYEKEEMMPGILVDVIGYQTNTEKIAIFEGELLPGNFSVINKVTGKKVYTGRVEIVSSEDDDECWGTGDFSTCNEPGEYYIEAELLGRSLDFKISETAYEDLFISAIAGLESLKCDTNMTEHVAFEDAPEDKLEVSGGWRTGENDERDVVECCLAILDLVKAYEYFPDAFTDKNDNNIADVLELIRDELSWLMKMQNPETGGVYASVSFIDGDVTRPVIIGETTRATAYYCATMARCSTVFMKVDKALSAEYIKAAGLAWNCLEVNADLVGQSQKFRAVAEMYKATGASVYQKALNEYLAINANKDFSERIELDGAMTYMSTNRKVELEYCTPLMQHFMSAVESIAGKARYARYLVRDDAIADDSLLWDAYQLAEADFIITSKEYDVIEQNYLHYLCGRNPESAVMMKCENRPDAYAQFVFLMAKIKNNQIEMRK